MKQSTFYYLLRRGVIGGGGLNPFVRDFRTRVLADGGTIESISCVQRSITNSPGSDFGRVTFDAFNTRVIADSGITEGRTCTINAINSLL